MSVGVDGGPPAVWPTSAPVDDAFQKRVASMAMVVMVFAGVELAWCLYRISAQMITGSLMRMYFTAISSALPAARFGKLVGPIDDLTNRIALPEIIRTLPFLACTCVLLWLGRRLHKRDLTALSAMRTWTFFAYGAIFVSVMLQVFLIVPAMIEYTESIMKTLPAMPPAGSAGAPPFDIKGMVSNITIASTVVQIALGSIVMSIFPIVLYIWAGRVRAAAGPAPET